MTAELRAERDEYLATLPQDAAVLFERDVLKRQNEQEEEDATLATMKADLKKMLAELRHAVLALLLKRVTDGDIDNTDLVTLYLKIK